MTAIGSLCTGYGGLDLAVEEVLPGSSLAWYSEIEPAAHTLLANLYPGVPNLGDLTALDWSTVPPVEVLTAGFPCQPFSQAGKRKGASDERHLWPHIAAAVGVLRPRHLFFENVRGLLSLGGPTVIGDLAGLGYDARWIVVRASDAGAPHARARVFIYAEPSALTERERHDGIGTEGAAGGAWGGRSDAAGLAGLTPYADGRGHGVEQDARGMGSVDSGDAGEARERQRARAVTDPGSDQPAPDAHGAGRGEHGGTVAAQPELDSPEHGLAGIGDSGGSSSADAERDGLLGNGAVDGERSRPQLGRGSEGSLPDSECGGWDGRAQAQVGEPVSRTTPAGRSEVDWGKYEPAIRRWEAVLGRPAPHPTIPGKGGRPRLSPYFDEWLMGAPEGRITGHGLTVPQMLKLCGNGVVMQQAILAYRALGVAA